MICILCADKCAESIIENCPGYDGDLDYRQLCDCKHCEEWDDEDCWLVMRDKHNARIHRIDDCADASHFEENARRMHNAQMQSALESGRTALLI